MSLHKDKVIAHRYRVEGPLGSGGLATTYRVWDAVYHREVALKLLHTASESLVETFHIELELLRGVVHPHLPRLIDFGLARLEAPRPYYTFELIEGETLLGFARGRPWEEIRIPLSNALDGLAFLHRLGVRHGDIAPDNVLVGLDGSAVLIDLSCSQLFGKESVELSGRPGFLAPELLRGDVGDVRSDLFALGECLAKVAEVLAEPLSPELMSRIHRLKSDDPEARPDSVTETISLLDLPPISGLRPLVVPPSRLIGRQPVIRRVEELLSLWSRHRPGSKALCLTGPPGVGRTRVMEEAKWIAQRQWAVVESVSGAPGAVGEMLSRSISAREPVTTLAEVIGVQDRLLEPTVFVLDDMHRLAPDDMEMLRWFIRTLGSGEDLAFVLCAGHEIPVGLAGACEEERLEPLEPAEVALWLSDTGLSLKSQHVAYVTGGYPGELSRLLADVRAGDITSVGIKARSSKAGWSDEHEERYRRLSPVARADLHDICIRHSSPAGELLPVSTDVAGAAELVAAGWARAEGWRLVLQRPMIAPALVSKLGVRTRGRLHREVAALCAEIEDDRAAAAEVYHRCLAGQRARAARMLLERSSTRADPDVWVQAARAVAESSDDADVQLFLCRVLVDAGEASEALRQLEVVRDRPIEIKRLQGEALMILGETERALTSLSSAFEVETDDIERAHIAEALARLKIDRGQYDEASRIASDALKSSLPDKERAELLLRLGAASSYLGDLKGAREHLEMAQALSSKGGDSRGRISALYAAALVEYRASQPKIALDLYQRALDEVRTADLPDMMVSLALNVATSHHQLGDWARAHALYREAMLPSKALGMVHVRATLEYNRAQLDADIGLFNQARAGASRAQALAVESGQSFFEAAGWSLLFEIGLWTGDPAPKTSLLDLARETFDALGAARERLWVDLQGVRQLRLEGEIRAAWSAFERLEYGEIDREMAARLSLERGQLHMSEAKLVDALSCLEQAHDDAEATHQRQLMAEIDGALAEAAEAHGARSLSAKHRGRALAAWERVALGLPAELEMRFWQHPLRRGLRLPSELPEDTPRLRGDDRVRRLLEINRKLTSTHKVQEVVAWTMDAAIELSGAERGFLILLNEQGKLHVPVARNVDREQIGRSQLKFSHTIAMRAINERTPIVTTDAAEDPRFGEERSVHAMRLKSVCVVPVQARDKVLGAVYLDNRFRRGGFGQDVVELLVAFADQVAIALLNARLTERLRARTEELERERGRIEQLLAEESQRVEMLSRSLEATQSTLQHRYDYSRIIGSSPGMQRVFEVLDRVIERPLTVLIDGESGTGKELCARAIHFNSPRKAGPFVSVNCGALPEPLLESELFGSVRGAFTGADRDRQGLFVSASGGTLFLDEFGEMSVSMQVKLLRVLEELKVKPVGSNDEIEIDVRLVCATNRDLEVEVAAGRFRSDLFYRVAVVRLRLPPLRERRTDVPLLCEALLKGIAEQHGISTPSLMPRALHALMAQSWPGNVRQLENVLTLAALTHDGPIDIDDLELPSPASSQGRRSVDPALERRVLTQLLSETGWNIQESAKRYGVSRPTFYRKLRLHRLERP